MAKANSNPKKKMSKKTKRNMRWTIAALFMVTAIVIALIPIQNGGVSAITAYTVPETIEEILVETPPHGIVGDTETVNGETLKIKITGEGTPEYAFPSTGNTYSVNDYTDSKTYVYTDIDMTTMETASVPVPVFELKKSQSSVSNPETITKYLGVPGSGSTPVGGTVNLGASVIVSDDVPATARTFFDNPTPGSTETKTIIEYEETPINQTMPNDSTINYAYIVLRHREHIYTYDDETGTQSYETGEWSEPVYVCKSEGATNKHERNIYYIGDNAFKNVQNISNMEIPANIAGIGKEAFYGCTNLASVNIGVNCKSIGNLAFAKCAKLTDVTFVNPAFLGIIGDGAFANTGVNSIILPSSNLAKIGSGAFFRCGNLTNVNFEQFKDASADIMLGCYVFSGCPISDIALYGVTKIASHDAGGTLITTPDITKYDTAKAQCGIFTKQEDMASALKTVCFPDYNMALPYGTFAGNTNLDYVKMDRPGGTFCDVKDPSADQPEPADEFYDEPDGFYIYGGQPTSTGPAAYIYAIENGITYGYWDSVNNRVTYELTKQGYKYTFAELSADTAVITDVTPTTVTGIIHEDTITIPYKIGQYEITEIGDNAFRNIPSKDTRDTPGCCPRTINIPDSIAKIGNNAFSDNPELETVNWYISDLNQANEISLGNECFARNPKLENINIRDDSHDQEFVNDPPITSIGTDAFKTESSSLTIKGKMGTIDGSPDGTLYAPYAYAIDPANRFNSGNLDYIIYESGNPENLSCQFDPNLGASGEVSLLSYPSEITEIFNDPAGILPTITIKDLLNTPAGSLSVVDTQIIDNYRNIYVPAGITSIENAYADGYTGVDDHKYFKNLGVPAEDGSGNLKKDSNDRYYSTGTQSVILTDVNNLPDGAFSSTINGVGSGQLNDIVISSLSSVIFLDDMLDIGNNPVENSAYVTSVTFANEGDYNSASDADPYYWTENGIIYSYTGKNEDGQSKTAVEECLPSTGTDLSGLPTNVDVREDILYINDAAFQNCDAIKNVDLSACTNLREIPDNCFFDADNLNNVILPDDCDSIGGYAFSVQQGNNTAAENYVDVYVPDKEVYIDATAFQYDKNATLHSYVDSAAERYAKAHAANVTFEEIPGQVTAYFYDYDGTLLSSQKIKAGFIPDTPADPPARTGYTFTGWKPAITNKIYTDTTYVAQYTDNSKTSSSGSSTSSSTSGSSTSGGSSSGSSSGGSSSRSSSSGSSSRGSSNSSSATRTSPVVVSGAPAPYAGSSSSAANGSATGTGTGSGNNVQTGNTNVVSTAPGIDNSKFSATVNGSSDNYVIKITETSESDELAKQALTGEFGSLDNIRYFPFDVSLYDSTGSQKISPVPEGVSVSVTMPIPDDLTIYGGNNKVGSTIGGNLEKIQPRFTVIDGVPCMNFTVTHLSPYVVYVDTANLTAGGVADATPKTADPIHPKWFLVIGFAAISIFLFLKRDKQPMPANIA